MFVENCSDVMLMAAGFGLTILMQRILEQKGHRLYWRYLFAMSLKERALREASKKRAPPYCQVTRKEWSPR
jgi:hypothetical protein